LKICLSTITELPDGGDEISPILFAKFPQKISFSKKNQLENPFKIALKVFYKLY